jgi:hypothetical protein
MKKKKEFYLEVMLGATFSWIRARHPKESKEKTPVPLQAGG